MNPVPVFTARVRGGMIQLNHQPEFESYLWTMEGRDDIEVIVAPRSRRRSLSQNAYYHVLVNLAAVELGNPPKALHRYFKNEFLPMGVSSTAGLNRQQFNDYLLHVSAWILERGIVIPPRHMVATQEVA